MDGDSGDGNESNDHCKGFNFFDVMYVCPHALYIDLTKFDPNPLTRPNNTSQLVPNPQITQVNLYPTRQNMKSGRVVDP